jgi:Ca2+-binding RTX toxin-like protein
MALTNVAALLGLGGTDTLAGGTGDDVLTGGAGNDSFLFRRDVVTGDDHVTDFDASGNDVIRLVGFGGTTFAAVRAATSFDAAGALIDFHALGGDGTVRLDGVHALTFGAEDFILG